MNKIYTGIGSRQTPGIVLTVFEELASELAKRGFILRSGGADGADSAFERGCDESKGEKQIFLPWKNFNGNKSNLIIDDYDPTPVPYDIAAKYRRNFFGMKQSVQKLLARDVYQVVGENLNNYSDFVICYTEGGKLKGGTSLALSVAKEYNIKVFNAGAYDSLKKFTEDILTYATEE